MTNRWCLSSSLVLPFLSSNYTSKCVPPFYSWLLNSGKPSLPSTQIWLALPYRDINSTVRKRKREREFRVPTAQLLLVKPGDILEVLFENLSWDVGVDIFLSSSDTDVPSKEDADMAFTCAITTCAFIASSSSSFMRACRHAARFSASSARCSDGVRFRGAGGVFAGEENSRDVGGDLFVEFSEGVRSATGCRVPARALVWERLWAVSWEREKHVAIYWRMDNTTSHHTTSHHNTSHHITSHHTTYQETSHHTT